VRTNDLAAEKIAEPPYICRRRRADLAAGERLVTSLLDRNNTGKNSISGDLGAVSAPASHCFDYKP
jgi:hypothetical protein